MLALVLGSALACAAKPVGRDGYAGEPVRAKINPDCDAQLLDPNGKACVQIDVFAEGEGEPATRGNWIEIHYIVEIEDRVLDSSHDGKPLKLQVGESRDVIDGMHLGVEGMRVGERRRFLVPPKLGYRGQTFGGSSPDANLVFFVELMDRRTDL